MELARIMVFNRLDAYVCDIDPRQILELRSTEEVNGEHALTIVTTQQLDKTNRIVLNDGMGIWHEYVVLGVVDTHETDQGLVTEYYCIWSLQYDLSATFVNDMYGCGIVPGHASVMHPVQDGLAIALSSTARWQIGTVTVTTEAAASFYRMSGWEGLQRIIEKWGGELQATITVGATGVVSRSVDLLSHVGASEATRRFDYGHDVASIKRTVSEDVWACRIIPLGASQETDEGGYTRRPDISSVNDGVMWLQDDEVVPYTRIPDGNGGWEYPTIIVENDTYEEPSELKAWALANISDYTRPKVTYEASVVQLARAGMNPHGVALGDEVVVVDREFGVDGLRISARVVKQECNLLDPSDTVLTIGNATDSLSSQFSALSRQVSEIAAQVSNASSYQSTADWLSRLLERLNAEANATGGFAYITEGQGIRTYDVAVSDPLVGSEASQVTDLRGGNIRFANSRTAGGDWDFTTLIQAGLVASKFLSATNITVGKMQSADGETWWDLDASELHTGVFWVLSNGVLVAKKNNGIGVFVSSSGTVTINALTWSNGIPTVGTSYMTIGASRVVIGSTDKSHITVLPSSANVSDKDGNDFIRMASETLTFNNVTVPQLILRMLDNGDHPIAMLARRADATSGTFSDQYKLELELDEFGISSHSSGASYQRRFTVDKSGNTNIFGALTASNENARLQGDANYIYLRDSSAHQWRFSKTSAHIYWHNGSSWQTVV